MDRNSIKIAIQRLEQKLEILRRADAILDDLENEKGASHPADLSTARQRKVGEPSAWAETARKLFSDGRARTINEAVGELAVHGFDLKYAALFNWLKRAVERREFKKRKNQYRMVKKPDTTKSSP